MPIVAQGLCTGAVVTFHDITRVKLSLAEKDQDRAIARRERARLRDVFHQTPVPISIVEGPHHIFALANLPYEKLMGQRKLLGLSIRNAFSALEGVDVHAHVDAVYRTGRPYEAREQLFGLTQSNGLIKKYFLNIIYHPLYAPGNKVEGVIMVVHDVTPQVVSRQALERSEARLRRMTEAMPQLVWMTDDDGRCTYLNGHYATFVGRTATELAGTAWQAMIHADDRVVMQRTWDTAVASNQPYETEYRLRRWDGVYRWMLVRGIGLGVSSEGPSLWLGTCTDIEGQRQLVQELHREREVRERFVTTMTHDLRSPLTAARLRAEATIERCADTDTVRKSLHKIVTHIERTDGMIQNLLDASSLRFGEQLPIDGV